MAARKIILCYLLLSQCFLSSGQITDTRFQSAYKTLENDEMFKHAIVSLYVVNNKTGEPFFSSNIETGLAPASCQKVITAATALDLLQPGYRYKTDFSYSGVITNGVLDGNIIIRGYGDPTFGSWRYANTRESNINVLFRQAVTKEKIQKISGRIVADETAWQGEAIPDGWIWQDIGSYYGAGARAINWRENQYDLFLKSGKKIGDTVQLVGTEPPDIAGFSLRSLATSAAKGTGDNAYIYFPLNKMEGKVRGTIPINEEKFSISGSLPHPALQMTASLEKNLLHGNDSAKRNTSNCATHLFYTYTSPPLDSIIFWFLKKSVNLYGESLIKTLGFEKLQQGTTDSGVSVVQRYWESKGIESSALHIIDGSGLSPANRVTTSSLVTIMEYAKKQTWFNAFYKALPEINGIKMKSGSIGGVVSYTGYIHSKTGSEYTFAFIINNYDGTPAIVRKKMWELLDLLK